MTYMSNIDNVANANTVGDTSITLMGGVTYQILVSGTFNGATVEPYIYDSRTGVWCLAGDGVTAAKAININAPSGTEFDIQVTGGDGSTSIDATPLLLEKNR